MNPEQKCDCCENKAVGVYQCGMSVINDVYYLYLCKQCLKEYPEAL